jgi:hypothetical protein
VRVWAAWWLLPKQEGRFASIAVSNPDFLSDNHMEKVVWYSEDLGLG